MPHEEQVRACLACMNARKAVQDLGDDVKHTVSMVRGALADGSDLYPLVLNQEDGRQF